MKRASRGLREVAIDLEKSGRVDGACIQQTCSDYAGAEKFRLLANRKLSSAQPAAVELNVHASDGRKRHDAEIQSGVIANIDRVGINGSAWQRRERRHFKPGAGTAGIDRPLP